MVVVFHSPSSLRAPIAMIRSRPSHSLMPSHFYRESADDRAIVLIACWATVVMTQRQSDKVCAPDIFWALLAKRNTEHGSGLGRWRWVVERTFAWLNQFRRLRMRYEKRADIHEAFLSLACALLCWNVLRRQNVGDALVSGASPANWARKVASAPDESQPMN